MSYYYDVLEPLGADDETAASPLYTLIDTRTAEILKWQKAEDSRRRWTIAITIGSALFAAVKLGVVVLPHLRTWHRERIGRL